MSLLPCVCPSQTDHETFVSDFQLTVRHVVSAASSFTHRFIGLLASVILFNVELLNESSSMLTVLSYGFSGLKSDQ